ncbi:ribosomal peptide maturation radical SAM protein 1 [Ruminiclostridium sufflavum DSM 19573]|uniref:Ribosomal peptide maturation radical SAM protein 1 n=1 Tax=Ruminiclostridium sufflavum DSM 19573 TaxID=1121337 RepID=A0A318XL00_9FIRM|nr:RiPP maturation radical SAM C-methyltransferase [Ruminiclostridium sufflavum]PYG87226.1 ribosomal peptide maturation radical SAM protein 1 [Ruminiclostridium sufflavum DSM 19573]
MIHIVNMPFGSLTHPALAPALIKAQLCNAGMHSKVFNFNFDFAKLIGIGEYETIAFFKGIETQIGEWLFAKEAWREPFGPSEEAFMEAGKTELENILKVQNKQEWLLKIRNEIVPSFLESCLNFLLQTGELQVVGFSCSFFQTISSLALGRLIKERYPQVKVVYGGACFHGEMGEELITKIPWIDAVSTGEADDIMVEYFGSLSANREPAGLQGIIYRNRNGSLADYIPNKPVSSEVLESLPTPDFSDFFEGAERIGLLDIEGYKQRVVLPFESSRGCWWGEKTHCKFCGLNGVGIGYRLKSAGNTYNILSEYAARYPVKYYQAADNNLSMSYFDTLLPRLKNEPLSSGAKIYYSVKPNMSRMQIKQLADAGIMFVQPGIESLSSHLLKLMGKGVTALQNIFYMKCCREYGITVNWNNLIRIPGEKKEDYTELLNLFPKLLHLRPPYGGSPKIECHRFSPYFAATGKYIENRKPQAWYSGLYPSDKIDISRVAYYFDADWKYTLNEKEYKNVIAAVLEWIRIWREEPQLPQLSFELHKNKSMTIIDSRSGKPVAHTLNPDEARLYMIISDPIHIKNICASLKNSYDIQMSSSYIEETLARFTEHGLALEECGKYLGLALPSETADPSAVFRKGNLRKINNQEKVCIK